METITLELHSLDNPLRLTYDFSQKPRSMLIFIMMRYTPPTLLTRYAKYVRYSMRQVPTPQEKAQIYTN